MTGHRDDAPAPAVRADHPTPREVRAMREELERLRRFVRAIIIEGHQGDVDGGWLQEAATDAGVLVEVEVYEPCGPECTCEEWDDFPQTCYRLAPELRPDPVRP